MYSERIGISCGYASFLSDTLRSTSTVQVFEPVCMLSIPGRFFSLPNYDVTFTLAQNIARLFFFFSPLLILFTSEIGRKSREKLAGIWDDV